MVVQHATSMQMYTMYVKYMMYIVRALCWRCSATSQHRHRAERRRRAANLQAILAGAPFSWAPARHHSRKIAKFTPAGLRHSTTGGSWSADDRGVGGQAGQEGQRRASPLPRIATDAARSQLLTVLQTDLHL
jgi:hypothetical protein